MVRRAEDNDPVLTEYVKERLAHLLAEQRPRRASSGTSGRPPAVGRPGLPTESEVNGVPELLPSDDDQGGDLDAGQWRARPAPPVLDDQDKPASALAFGRAHLGVVVALVVVGLLFAGWTVLRARPVAMANPVAVPSAQPSLSPAPARTRASGTATSPAARIMVHVLGAVRTPGVVTLPATARVRDALAAAGGLSARAAPGELNLAQVLADGQQIVVGTRRKPAGEVRSGATAGDGPPGTGASPTGAAVDLNRATETQLETLPGVGPVTAAKIVAWRTEHGRFTKVEELQEVDGIGPKTYAEIAPHARV